MTRWLSWMFNTKGLGETAWAMVVWAVALCGFLFSWWAGIDGWVWVIGTFFVAEAIRRVRGIPMKKGGATGARVARRGVVLGRPTGSLLHRCSICGWIPPPTERDPCPWDEYRGDGRLRVNIHSLLAHSEGRQTVER